MIDGKYSLSNLMGIGGSSRVYSCVDINDNEEYAVKVIRKDKGYTDQVWTRLVEMEANTMVHLGEHPNLVNFVDANKSHCVYKKMNSMNNPNKKEYVTVAEEINYLVLEKCENGALSKYVKTTGLFDELTTRFLFTQLCGAVNFMHSQEYVHLDIKLDNILLDKYFNIKLADLGIALWSRGTTHLLAHKRGTAKYMAPEVANCDSKRPYNVYPADIYSLGVCLHLMLFGTYPIADSDSEMSTDEENDGSPKLKQDSSPRLDSSSCLIAAYLSEDCLDLLERMLSQDPSMRPTIEEIENHPWMSQEFPEQIGEIVYSELNERCNHIKSLVADSSPSFSIDLD